MTGKIAWKGKVLGIQPRIRLIRSFDERHHEYLGYVLTLDGTIGGEIGTFSVAVGPSLRDRHEPRAGDWAEGTCLPVADERREVAGYYKVSGFRVTERGDAPPEPPPWLGVPPALTTYRERGHRRLAARTYDTQCHNCIWGCRMPVEMIVDHWNPSKVQYRFETFCYGPKSCPLYKPGPKRQVPGRHGQSFVEEDWIDEEAVRHRAPDD